MSFLGAVYGVIQWVFGSSSIAAQAIRFIGGTLLSQALAGNREGPRINDLKVQVSRFGVALPRLYGERVRVAGNVIQQSDLKETKHRVGGFGRRSGFSIVQALGGGDERFFGLGRQSVYTYSVDLAVAIGEGPLPVEALKKIRANGRVIVDIEGSGTPPVLNASGFTWTRAKADRKTSVVYEVRYYRGDAVQTTDPLMDDLVNGDGLPYRHTAYVVLWDMQLADFGNQIPNLEFEIETGITRLGDVVTNIASFADVDVYDNELDQTLKGYVIATEGSVWSAIEPLAAAFAFDMISEVRRFAARLRGRAMRTIVAIEDFFAAPAGQTSTRRNDTQMSNPDTYPDEVTVTYIDAGRDYQPNTQRAFRNEGFSRNKINVEVPLVLNADEARLVADRTLYESIANTRKRQGTVSEKYRWLNPGDIIGVPLGEYVEPWRVNVINKTPGGVVEIEQIYEDPLAYTSDALGAIGTFEPSDLEDPGDAVFQPIDAAITSNDDDNDGFYFAIAGTGLGYTGATLYRLFNGTYAEIGPVVQSSIMADCETTLADGPTDVWDYANTLTISAVSVELPDDATEDDVVNIGANLAWVGPADGQGGEYIHFTTITADVGSPQTYTLSGFLRGRFGTEFATATHGAGERIVILANDTYGRLDLGITNWNVAQSFKAAPQPFTDIDVTADAFTPTGEGKRPLSPVHLTGTRNGANDDILIGWTRRSRLEYPPLGTGPVPLGEATEAYEVDIYADGSPLTVVRTLTATSESVNYTEAMQTADGHTLGALVKIAVYQMSATRGRGHPAEGTV